MNPIQDFLSRSSRPNKSPLTGHSDLINKGSVSAAKRLLQVRIYPLLQLYCDAQTLSHKLVILGKFSDAYVSHADWMSLR